MPDPTAPQPVAAPAAAPPSSPESAAGDPLESAVAAYRARQDQEAAAAGGKGSNTGTGPTDAAKPGASPAPGGTTAEKPRPRAADISAIAQREHQARETERQAKLIQERYKPLDEALAKKDLVGAMTALAQKHGFEFKDFVAAMAADPPAEKTPAEVAATTVAEALKKRDDEQAAAQKEANRLAFEAKQQATRDGFVAQAEAGTPDNPDRWELTHVAGVGGQAWDLIAGHYEATCKFDAQGNMIAEGEKMTREQALDYIEAKLAEKRDARRAKRVPATGSGAGNGHNEAAGNPTGGRAAVPSFGNRATSGMPAVAGATPVDDALDLPDHERVARAAARAGIRLY